MKKKNKIGGGGGERKIINNQVNKLKEIKKIFNNFCL